MSIHGIGGMTRYDVYTLMEGPPTTVKDECRLLVIQRAEGYLDGLLAQLEVLSEYEPNWKGVDRVSLETIIELATGQKGWKV